MAALASGHLATDFANGALPALLPFLADEFDLSYALVGVAMLAWAFSSSILQPLFGLWSDRRGALWLLPAGLALGGVGIGLATVAPSYGLCLALITLSGLGTAAYHPEGSKFASYVSGRRRASGMSLFSIGGNVRCLPLFPDLFVCWARGALLVIGPAAFAALFSALCAPVASAL